MQTVSDYFGSLVFDDRVMRARLPEKVYKSLKKTIDEGDEKRCTKLCAQRNSILR